MGLNAFTSKSIELYIEELILTGFHAGDRLSIGAAIEQELSRLISQQGIHGIDAKNQIFALKNADRLDAGSIRIAANAKPQQIGQQVAQRVYRQLAPGSTSPPQPSHGRSKR